MHYVYFIQSTQDQSVYVGLTNDLKNRLLEHNARKARSTKSKTPYQLIYYEAYLDKLSTRKRELHIKRSWSEKEAVLKRINH